MTSGAPVVVPAHTPKASVMERQPIQVEVEVAKLPQVILVQGYRITILSAEAGAVRYSIDK